MHPAYIANTIAKRRRELDIKLQMAEQENSTMKIMASFGTFLAEMDLLVARIRAEESE